MEALRPGDPRNAGAYRLIARLGAGGMGRVFLGRSARGRMVAVKLVHPELARDPEFRRRFRNEVEAARRVGGEWTAAVLDADTESETPWVATAYVPGPGLQEVVDLHGPLPEASVLALAAGLARALRAVHGNDLIHRDLKPSNVLVTIDGPRLIDFGIARSVDSGVTTRTGTLIGSPGFMSPEQVRGTPLTPASDVFSLGAVLAYAATGRRPFGGGGSLHAQLFRVATEPADLGDLDGPVRDLVDRCLAKEPGDRPALDELLGDPPGDGTWLPAEVVAELGRHAARLLDVEDPDTEPRPPPVPPRTVPPEPVRPPHPPPGGTRRAPRPRMPLYLAMGAAAAAGVVAAGLVFALTRDEGNGGAEGGGPSTLAGERRAGQPRPGASEAGDVPADMLGSWETGTGGPVESDARVRRFTVTQGGVGDRVLTLLSVTDDRLCEYEGTLRDGGPTLRLEIDRTRSIPKGCAKEAEVFLALEAGKVRYESGETNVMLTRARSDSVPEQYRGTWEGAIGRPTASGPSPSRKRFELTAGRVGTEAVKITVLGEGASPCSAMATLVSAEDEIVLYSSRLLTFRDGCELGGMQKLVPRPDGSLRWESGTGSFSNLSRA